MSPTPSLSVTQLDATPTTWLASSYHVRGGGDGIARLRLRWLQDAARLDVGGRRYRVRRDGEDLVLERRGRRLASARKSSEFARALEVCFGGDRWELRARPMRRAFKILHRGRRVGEIEPAAWYERHARLTVPHGLPEDLGYFLMVLVLLWWRRRRSAHPV